MEYTAGAVHFHDDGSASCLLTTRASAAEAFMHEMCFWAAFANRQFNNMGRDGVNLAERLVGITARLPDDESADEVTLPELFIPIAEADPSAFTQQPHDEPPLTDKHPGAAKKRFEAQLKPHGEGFRFALHMKGFGLLGRGLDRYSPWSVTLLLCYLIRKYREDPKKMAILAALAVFTGQSYALGQVNMRNADMRASLAVGGILAEFGELD